MTRTILCFGDSNTYGTPPIKERGTGARHPAGTRWPTVMAAALGPDWTLVEEGLPGRTAQFDDPVMGAHMNGQIGLRIALQSHGPIDLLVLMLGTNDVKQRFAPTTARVTAGIAGLLDIALGDEYQQRHGGFSVLLLCPPPVKTRGTFSAEFHGAREVSLNLPAAYKALAESRGCGFLDTGTLIETSEVDGIHFEAPAHHALGLAVADAVTNMFA